MEEYQEDQDNDRKQIENIDYVDPEENFVIVDGEVKPTCDYLCDDIVWTVNTGEFHEEAEAFRMPKKDNRI